MVFSSRFTGFAGAMVAAVAIAAPALAQDAKTVFEPRYAELHAATDARDMTALGKIVTPDYQMTDIRGDTHNLTEMQGMFAKLPQDPAMKPKYAIVSATISGASAVVQQQMQMHVKRPMEDGSVAELDITIISDDTWIQQSGVWLLQKTVQKDISVAKDGEVVFHQAV